VDFSRNPTGDLLNSSWWWCGPWGMMWLDLVEDVSRHWVNETSYLWMMSWWNCEVLEESVLVRVDCPSLIPRIRSRRMRTKPRAHMACAHSRVNLVNQPSATTTHSALATTIDCSNGNYGDNDWQWLWLTVQRLWQWWVTVAPMTSSSKKWQWKQTTAATTNDSIT